MVRHRRRMPLAVTDRVQGGTMKTIPFKLVPLFVVVALLLIVAPGAAAQSPNPVGADIAVTGTATSNVARSLIRYEINVTNLGGARAGQIHLTQTLASVTRFVSVTTSRGQCTGGAVVTCAAKNLGANKTMKIVVIVSRTRVPCTLDCSVPITSKVTVTTGTFDPTAQNNSLVLTVH